VLRFDRCDVVTAVESSVPPVMFVLKMVSNFEAYCRLKPHPSEFGLKAMSVLCRRSPCTSLALGVSLAGAAAGASAAAVGDGAAAGASAGAVAAGAGDAAVVASARVRYGVDIRGMARDSIGDFFLWSGR